MIQVHKISVAIITLNEEANIKSCIESVLPIADEVIVVDSGSTDATVAIAKSLGAEIIQHEFSGFIEQKNFAMDRCKYEFMLSVDADEVLDNELLNRIKEYKTVGFTADGYVMCRLNHLGNKPITHGVWGNDKQLRLVKKSLAKWEGMGVHERLSVQSTNIITLEGNLLHHSYKTTDELFVKTKKYAELASSFLFNRGDRISPIMVYVKAWSRFIKHYFVKAGFMDGNVGWLIGKQQYMEAFWKYQRLRELAAKESSTK